MSNADTHTDGRRQRGADNRASIVRAMLELVRAGSVMPTAEAVAARAKVGLRTVFRHFDDMESLYREMASAIEALVLPAVNLPFTTTHWRERIVEIADRRAGIFETIMPFRIATDVARHTSPFIAKRQARFSEQQREMLRVTAPERAVAHQQAFEALCLLLSPEAWIRLRREQNLSPEQARAVLAHSAISICEAAQ